MALKTEKNFLYNADLLIILIFLSGISIFFHGRTAVYMLLSCTTVSIVLDYAGTYLISKKNSLTDMSAINTGIMTALMLSPDAPIWLGVFASALSVILGRLLFAKKGNYTFAPAAAGITAAELIFPYTFDKFTAGETVTQMLDSGKTINMTIPGIFNTATGNVPGFMGTTSAVFIIAALIFLAIRRPKILLSSLSFTGVCVLFAVFFPRIYSGTAASVIMELLSGSFLFCAVLLLPYPSIELKCLPALFYGILAGGIYVLLSRYTPLPDAAPAAVLISGVFYTLISLIPSGGNNHKEEVLDEQTEEKEE